MVCSRRPDEADRTVYGRVIVFMQFASYLRDLGFDSYIPPSPKHPNDHLFIPYVFTREEMGRFFVAVDDLRLKHHHRQSVIFALPLFFRLLYGTGVRLNEATALLNKDIDLDNNCFVINDSQNGQQRIVPISNSLSNACKKYLLQRDRIGISTQPEDHFFITLRGVKLYQSIIYAWFKKAILTAGIPYSGDLKGPRIHDLRHTFAVHSMAAMAESGSDLYVSLPILSGLARVELDF